MKCQAGWTQAGIIIAGRNISNLRYTDDTIVMTENKQELKSLLRSVKEGSESMVDGGMLRKADKGKVA